MIKNIKKILGLYKTAGVVSKDLIKQYLPEDAIIIEAGASTGEDTLELAQTFPNGKIYAFEPLPNIYKKMCNKVKACNNVFTFEMALGEKTGRAKINISSQGNNSSSSLLNPKEHLNFHPDIKFDEALEVKTISLDDFIKEHNLPRVDFLWLDMQGFEYSTLYASDKIFDSIKALYTEVSLIETYEGVPLYPEYRKWLESKGMKVVKEELAWKDMGNVLFVK